jgi:hypothetical protein
MPASNFTPRLVMPDPVTLRGQGAPKRFGARRFHRLLLIASGHLSKAALAAGQHAVALLSIAAAILAMPAIARGDGIIFVTNFGSPNETIGEYTTSGATVNASLITGFSGAQAVAVSGSDLFVLTWRVGTERNDRRLRHLGGASERLSGHGIEPGWHRRGARDRARTFDRAAPLGGLVGLAARRSRTRDASIGKRVARAVGRGTPLLRGSVPAAWRACGPQTRPIPKPRRPPRLSSA